MNKWLPRLAAMLRDERKSEKRRRWATAKNSAAASERASSKHGNSFSAIHGKKANFRNDILPTSSGCGQNTFICS